VLRAWERRYQVVAPTRTGGGQRLYSQLDIERLSRLQRLTDRGYPIGRLAALDLDELTRLAAEDAGEMVPERRSVVSVAEAAGSGAAEAAAAALRATRQLDAAELQTTLERAAVTLGVPEFLDGVLAPVLSGIGQGWRDRSVSVAHEHLASAAVRRVLGWLLGVYELDGPAPRLVVATPPGQVHELGALMVAVSAAAEGWTVTYLGPDLPVADLVSASAQTEARAVAVSVVYVPDERSVAADLRDIRAGLPARVPLLLGGAGTAAIGAARELPGVIVIDSLSELRSLLRRLREEDVT
jgi:methanogenic corrinoid protein MtbC1